LTAIFADFDASTVRLIIPASNLTDAEFVDDGFFNFNPNLNLDALTFSYVSSGSTQAAPSLSTRGQIREPAMILLFGTGLAGLSLLDRSRRRTQAAGSFKVAIGRAESSSSRKGGYNPVLFYFPNQRMNSATPGSTLQ